MGMKRVFAIVIMIMIFLMIAAGFFAYLHRGARTIFFASQPNVNPADNVRNTEPPSGEPALFVSGWLPYWAKNEGALSLANSLSLFDEVNLFAFGVNSDGSLRDVLKIKNDPWPKLIASAKDQNVKVIPTILWGDAKAMHNIFSNSALRSKHVEEVENMLEQNNFSGVDIDYEGKDIADRDNFTAFLRALKEKLAENNKSLSCAVEARTQDDPPAGFTGTRAMSYANDFSALNLYCDQVRIMAYDQVFQINRANFFEESGSVPSAPNADIRWVESVMRYALGFITPEKLVLGVPTYGWEFRFAQTATGYRYTRMKSVSYPEALARAEQYNVAPERTPGGELSYIYNVRGEKRLVTFSDAEAVKQKMELAKNLGLRGISLFKLDGLTDPDLFSVLGKERK